MERVAINKEVDIDWIDIEKLEENVNNPNVMDNKNTEGLKQNMQKFGYIEFLVVVKNPNADKYLIIDGHHRAKQLKDEGHKQIPVLIAKNVPYAQALLGAWTFNRWRGKTDAKKIAQLLYNAEAEQKLTAGEICKITGLSKLYYEEYLASIKTSEINTESEIKKLAKMEEDGIKQFTPLKSTEIEEMERLFTVSLKPKIYKKVIDVLDGYPSWAKGMEEVFYKEKINVQKSEVQ